jgi:hypothetical protein
VERANDYSARFFQTSVVWQVNTPRPESSDMGTQVQKPADACPLSSRNEGLVADPHGRQTGRRHAPPWAGNCRPDGSAGSGGHAIALVVS